MPRTGSSNVYTKPTPSAPKEFVEPLHNVKSAREFASEEFENTAAAKISNIHDRLTGLQDALFPVLTAENPETAAKEMQMVPIAPILGTFQRILGLLDVLDARVDSLTQRVRV